MKKYSIVFALSFLTYGIAFSVIQYVSARAWADWLVLLFGVAVLYEILYVIALRKKDAVSLKKAIAFYFLCFFTECELIVVGYYARLFVGGYTPSDFLGNVNGETVYGFEAIAADSWAHFIFVPVLLFAVTYQVVYFAVNNSKGKNFDKIS